MTENNKKGKSGYVKHAVFIIFFAAVLYFFIKSFRDNAKTIEEENLTFNLTYIALSVLFLMLHYVSTAFCWRMLINDGNSGRHLSIKESIGINFTSAMTKYLPGKVWSYAFQFYVLTNKGFILSKVVFDNIVLLTISVATVAMIAVVYLTVTILSVALPIKLAIILGAAVIYSLCLVFFSKILESVLNLVSKIAKKDFVYYKVSGRRVLKTQGYMILSYTASAAAAVSLCYGINITGSFLQAFEIAVSSIISAMIGLVTLFAPGGLGVQESALHFLLKDKFSVSAAIVFPIAYRLAILITDSIRAAISFFCMKNEIKLFKSKKEPKK